MTATLERRPVLIPAGAVTLNADLSLPELSRGLVVFAHGSGSSRHSSRNKLVAERLVGAGFATLLLDLLSVDEEREDQHLHHLRFDIALLADRLAAAATWTGLQPATKHFDLGYFGASTGAAAALVAAAAKPERVRAIVSRGGRPDMAGEALGQVTAPTLLIVGGHDVDVLRLNQHAKGLFRAHAELETVPDATHLFEEPGTLERVADLAADWFDRYL